MSSADTRRRDSTSGHSDRGDPIKRRAVLQLAGLAVTATIPAGVVSGSDGEGATGYGYGRYGEGGYGSTDEPSPLVTTGKVTERTESSAKFIGELSDTGGADETTCYFEWRELGREDWNATTPSVLETEGTFSHTVSTLESDTAYEVRAVGEAGTASDIGDTRTFRTEPEANEQDPPKIDRFELEDRSNPVWLRTRIDWRVTADADLVECKTEFRVGGTTVDTETSSISGSTATGEHNHRYRTRRDRTAEVVMTVTDVDGREASESKSLP